MNIFGGLILVTLIRSFKKNIFDKKIKLVTKENKRKLFIKNNCCEAVYNKITLT